MTIQTSQRAKNAAPRRLDWVAPSVHRLAAGSAEEEGTFQTDLFEAKS
jgi:hypothetical protein